MFQIKILKQFEDDTKFQDFKNFMGTFSRKNKEITKDAWILKFEKKEDFLGAIVQIASKIGEYKVTDIIFGYCCSQQLNNDEAQRFIDSFYLYYSDFVGYVLNCCIISLMFYVEDNDVLNIDSYLRFNMDGLEKEVNMKLEDADALANIFEIADSNLLDRLTFIELFSSAVEILESENKKLEKFKDFKIYDEGGIKCIADNKTLINRKYFADKYDVIIEDDTSEIESIALLTALFVPQRVIIYSSITEEEKSFIMEALKSLKDVIGEINIMTADEKKPR